MDEWLQLTKEDIARAHRLTQEHSPMPEIIILRQETDSPSPPSTPPSTSPEILTVEIPPPPEPIQPRVTLSPIRITADDFAPTPPQTKPSSDLQQLEKMMYELVCQEREKHLPGWVGTARLGWQEGLAAVARGHSADMLKRQYVAHITPEGITAARRLEQNQIRYLACGENIGVVYGEASHGTSGVQQIHNAFMNQPRSLTNHRGNLLNPIWTHIGIGIAYSPDGAMVVTQNFISMPSIKRTASS